MISISKIMVNYQEEPVGIEKVEQIGWVINGNENERNMIQATYQIQVAKDSAFGQIIYDSGEITSSSSSHISLPNLTVASKTKYYLRVKIGTNVGASDWQSTSFVTALLNNEFTAEFISIETAKDKDDARGSYIRKEIQIEKQIESAYAFTTALGLYHFYVNGDKVSEDEFAPGWTSYHHHHLYQIYDLKDYLKQGGNALGAVLGAGWYKGTMGFKRRKNIYGERTAFLCQIEILYTDGTREQILTDATWQGQWGPIDFSEIYDGETYDARKEITNWCQTSCDYQEWQPVSIVAADKSVLCAVSGAKVKPITKLPAAEIIKTPKGETVIDFRQNLTGWIQFRVCAKPGDIVELKCFEVLDADGNAYYDNLRSAKATIKYICRGTQEELYHPYFSFQGFRYATVVSYPGEITLEKFTAYAVHSEMKELGHFECSNADINQLHHNIKWGMKGNFLDVPTDCPQRDERLGWTGDAQIFCRTAGYLMDTYTFYRKWLRDVALDSSAEGAVPHVVPDILTGHVEGDWLLEQGTYGATAWADAITVMPWTLYLTYGDKIILAERYDNMKNWIDFMSNHAVDCIWNYQLQFGDWVALDAEEGSYFGATPNDLTCTAYYAYSTQLFVKSAQALGRNEDADKYQKLYQEIVTAYQEKFFDQSGHMNVQTQTAQILSLYFGLVKEEHCQNVVADLLKLLEQENGHLVTGFVGTPYFCHALSQNGCTKEAYKLLLKDDFPSWLYQVKQGATTIWEHWDGLKPDGTMWSPDMNSFNHYAYGAVGEWLYRVAAGIEIDEAQPGYKNIIIAPHIGGDLDYVKASYESIYGTIVTGWNKNENQVELSVCIPANTTAAIKLIDGIHIIDSDGISFTKDQDGFLGNVGSGTYVITYQIQQ